MLRNIFSDIQQFNTMYGMPTPDQPTLSIDLVDRLGQVKTMLLAEVNEVDLVIEKMKTEEFTAADVLTEVSDWLGDLCVYALSEGARHGLPMADVLSIIMDSNFSKLQNDGTALFEEGKLQKGPNYWKPEPQIRELLIRSVK